MRVYFQGAYWEAQNRRWVLTEALELGKYFEVVKAPQDADFIFAFDPLLPDMDAVVKAGKPIVWRIFAGYAKSRIEEVRDKVVLGLINSEVTRSDFLRSYPYEPPPMELVYHPLNRDVFMFQPVELQEFTYYMYVGMIMKLIADRLPIACGIYYEKNMRGLNIHYYKPGTKVKEGDREITTDYPNYQPSDVDKWRSLGVMYRAVDACGLGLTLIDATIFKLLQKPWFMTTMDTGEDIHFFTKVWRELKLKPVADLDVKAKHLVGPGFLLDWRGNTIHQDAF